jgi:hypothetical protein
MAGDYCREKSDSLLGFASGMPIIKPLMCPKLAPGRGSRIATGRPRADWMHLRERSEIVCRNQKPASRGRSRNTSAAVGKRMSSLLSACVAITLFIGGCVTSAEKYLTEQQALDAAWKALEPNVASHNRANWRVSDVRLADGHKVANLFEGEPAPGCWARLRPLHRR